MSASSSERCLLSSRVVTPTGLRDAAVTIRDERIVRVCDRREVARGVRLEDLGDLVLMPGLVDTHVHINEPGRAEWEGFETATLAGGITTLVDMPINSKPAVTTAKAFREKYLAAFGKCHVDVGFHGGLVAGGADRMPELIEAGALGIKAFLCDSGVDDFPPATEADLRRAMPCLSTAGVPLLVHAELVDQERVLVEPSAYRDYLASRPEVFEERAVEMLIELSESTHCAVHVVHLSSAKVLSQVEAARERGVPLSAETCPHYLFFESDNIPNGETSYKCTPPIRSRDNRLRLWKGLKGGIISAVVSDHSPCLPEMKRLDMGSFDSAWGGISSLGLGLPIVWTEGRKQGIGPTELARWMCSAPARLVGLGDRKGQIAAGFDADLVAWDPEPHRTVEAGNLFFRHKLTPYVGSNLAGVVRRTYLRGREIFRDGELLERGRGQIVTRTRLGPEASAQP